MRRILRSIWPAVLLLCSFALTPARADERLEIVGYSIEGYVRQYFTPPSTDAEWALGWMQHDYQFYFGRSGSIFYSFRSRNQVREAAGGKFVVETGNRWRWERKGGRIYLQNAYLPGSDKGRTTYFEIMKIYIEKSPSGFQCFMERTYHLRPGQNEYTEYHSETQYWRYVFGKQEQECTVRPGNVFAPN